MMIEPGAREFLLKTLFTNFTPHYVGNYVKLAVDLISTMKQFGESKLTAKMVITLTDPGNELALT